MRFFEVALGVRAPEMDIVPAPLPIAANIAILCAEVLPELRLMFQAGKYLVSGARGNAVENQGLDGDWLGGWTAKKPHA